MAYQYNYCIFETRREIDAMNNQQLKFWLLKKSIHEATLVVHFRKGLLGDYYANLVISSKISLIADEIAKQDLAYYFKKHLLIIQTFEEDYLEKIIAELEASGDFIEVMAPLSKFKALHFFYIQIIEKIKHYVRRIF